MLGIDGTRVQISRLSLSKPKWGALFYWLRGAVRLFRDALGDIMVIAGEKPDGQRDVAGCSQCLLWHDEAQGPALPLCLALYAEMFRLQQQGRGPRICCTIPPRVSDGHIPQDAVPVVWGGGVCATHPGLGVIVRGVIRIMYTNQAEENCLDDGLSMSACAKPETCGRGPSRA
jgi:hypothetical protein